MLNAFTGGGAIARKGKFVHLQSYGFLDKSAGTKMTNVNALVE